MWALLEVQKQQPIMFPYPYLQSSPKMQAKAKAQLFCFWKFSLFSSLIYRGWRKTYFSKQKFGVLSQRRAHIILVPFWRVLKKTAGFWPYGGILGAVSFPHSSVNHRTRTDNVTAVAHRSVWKPPAFETMKNTLYATILRKIHRLLQYILVFMELFLYINPIFTGCVRKTATGSTLSFICSVCE